MMIRYILACVLLGSVFASGAFAEVQNSGEALDIRFPSLVRQYQSGTLAAAELADFTVGVVEQLGTVPDPISNVRIENKEFRIALGDKLFERISKILATESSASTLSLKRLSELFLPSGDKNRVNIDRIIELSERAEHLAAIGDSVALVQMRGDLKTGQEKIAIERRITQVLTQQAQDKLAKNAPSEALELLAYVTDGWWAAEQRKLAQQAISDLTVLIRKRRLVPQRWPFSDAQVKSMVPRVVEGDSAISEMLAEAYSWWVLVLVTQNNIDTAREFYDDVIKLRPDPNDLNDDMRFGIAMAADTPEAKALAQGRLIELKLSGSLSFWRKLRLLFNGYYGRFFPVSLTIALICAVVFSLMSLARINFPHLRIFQMLSRSSVAGYKNPMGDLDEYSRLLAYFGLDDSASEDDIKKIYRQKMKDSHPDVAGENADGKSALDPEDFMTLKNAYDRILEIRKSRFSA